MNVKGVFRELVIIIVQLYPGLNVKALPESVQPEQLDPMVKATRTTWLTAGGLDRPFK